MTITFNQQTYKKLEALKEVIVNDKGETISNKKLFAAMIDMFYDKLIGDVGANGEND